MPENTLAETVIYTLPTATPDTASATLLYQLWQDPRGDYQHFTFDSATRELKFRNSPDFETDQTSYELLFRVTATDGSVTTFTERTIQINVTDVNENAPSITSSDTGAALVEGTEVDAGTAVYTATGTGAITWTLEGADADLFDIDGTTGAVTFKQNHTPDHEAKTSYAFTIVATSGAFDPVKQDVTIQVTDINDEAPVFPVNTYVLTASDTVHLYETGVNGPLQSGAPSAATHTFLSNVDLTTGRFGADGTNTTIKITLLRDTGAVEIVSAVAGLPSTGNGSDHPIWAVNSGGVWSIKSISGGSTTPSGYDDAVFLYTIADNGGSSDFTFYGTQRLADGQTANLVTRDVHVNIDENIAAGSAIYTVTQPVLDVEMASVSYGLVAGGDSDSFTIDQTTGRLSIGQSPDFELKESYTVIVRASATLGSDTTTADLVVHVNINNIDDNAPVFASPAAQGLSEEGVKASWRNDQFIFTAIDTGEGGNNIQIESINNNSLANGTAVAIVDDNNPNKIIVYYDTFANIFDIERALNAIDDSGDQVQSLISVDLVPGASRFFSTFNSVTLSGGADVITVSINENSADDVTIFTATATDADGDNITYSITAGNDDGLFEIDASSGVVTIASGQNPRL